MSLRKAKVSSAKLKAGTLAAAGRAAGRTGAWAHPAVTTASRTTAIRLMTWSPDLSAPPASRRLAGRAILRPNDARAGRALPARLRRLPEPAPRAAGRGVGPAGAARAAVGPPARLPRRG